MTMSRDIEITIDREVIAELTGAKPKRCDEILDQIFIHQDILLEQIDETLINMIDEVNRREQ
jgi:hypothetical protein